MKLFRGTRQVDAQSDTLRGGNVPTSNIARSKSKLGSHRDQAGYQGQIEQIINSGCRVYFTSADPGTLRDVHAERGDDVTLISRHWKYGGINNIAGRNTDDFLEWGINSEAKARQAAHEWVQAMIPTMQESPQNVYWHAVNEPAFTEQLPLLAIFEAERQRIMHEEGGWKAALFNFPVGFPRVAEPNDDWPKLYPALEAAHEYGNVVSLHEYWPALPWIYYGDNQSAKLDANQVEHFPAEWAEGWLFARYRKIWRHHIEANGWGNIRIVLKEFGSSFVTDGHILDYLGALPGAWRDCGDIWRRLLWETGVLPPEKRNGEDTYLELLKWCDSQMRIDPYLIGCCVFCDGTIGQNWGSFKIDGLMSQKMYAYVGTQR